jgi:hypothetical protein
MRTTVTLDADVARALKTETHRTSLPFKQVLNELLRRALAAAPVERKRPFRVKPHKTRLAAGVDPLRFNQLLDDLDAETFVGRARRS